MKIMYIVESLGGGVLSYLSLLTDEMVSQGNEVILLYGIRKQTPKNLEEIFNKDVKLVQIENFQRSINALKDYRAYHEIKKIILNSNPDIVHLNSSKAGAIGRLIKFFNSKKLRKVAFFYTPHGYSFLMGNESILKRNIYYVVEKYLSKLNTVTIACGMGEYKTAKNIDKNARYVNNCVDLEYIDSFIVEETNTADNYFYTVGRITNQKNPKLFNEIAENHPELNFVWIGDGPLKNSLTSSNIEITGWLSNSEVMKYIQKYNNFILTSKWEGLPIVLLEAMASRKECFVTNVRGNSEVINEKNGYTFDSVQEFNKQYDIFLEGKKNRKGELARKDVESLYSKESFVNGYLDIYSR